MHIVARQASPACQEMLVEARHMPLQLVAVLDRRIRR